jgi:hypothetical protein
MSDEDTISIVWSVEDVLTVRPDLTKDQARDVLYMVEQKHDASMGVCWETLEIHADWLFPLKEVNE